MMERALHIVCLRMPLPIDFGANYDLYYKLEALHSIGVHIHFHCFIKNEAEKSAELYQVCKTVHYYKRSKKIIPFLPYIVSSRMPVALTNNLLKDELPILVEGMHCSGMVLDERFANRKIYVRAHNVEYLYYKGLAQTKSLGLKKLYYSIESWLLKKYEQRIAAKVTIIAISQSDADFFTTTYKAKNVTYIPIFYKGKPNMPLQLGSFCLYHGNLSVSENEKAVEWLLKNVFNDLEIPFVVAGRNPSKKLIALSHQHLHTCIAANPSKTEMDDMVRKAQINVLPSINATGIKLKLLNSLYNGRFCITNIKGANGFEEKNLFAFADDALSMKQLIKDFFYKPFTEEDALNRSNLLEHKYNLAQTANKLSQLFWKP